VLKSRIAALGAACALSLTAQTPVSTTDIHAADIQAFLRSLPRDKSTDQPIRVVDVGGYKVGIYAVFRPKGSKSNFVAHKTKITEVYESSKGQERW